MNMFGGTLCLRHGTPVLDPLDTSETADRATPRADRPAQIA